MNFPSETEITEIFEKLGLKSEEERQKALFKSPYFSTLELEPHNEHYYTIRLSDNTKILEDNYNAKLEGGS